MEEKDFQTSVFKGTYPSSIDFNKIIFNKILLIIGPIG